MSAAQTFSPLPGFRLSVGLTMTYLGVIVLLPLAGLLLRAAELSWGEFWQLATTERALAAYRLSLGGSLVAASVNACLGAVLAWVLVRYEFPFRRLIDGLVDIPFALPTAVAGLTLADLFAPGGWLGRFLTPLGIQGAFSPLGVVIALTFVGLPFVVRTLQPVLQQLDPELEEAAAILGAGRLRTLWQVVLPALSPALLTGFALAFARALGEYGSVLFISSNLPLKTEIAPMVIATLLDQYEYRAAIVVAVMLLLFSFALLAGINFLERRASLKNPGR